MRSKDHKLPRTLPVEWGGLQGHGGAGGCGGVCACAYACSRVHARVDKPGACAFFILQTSATKFINQSVLALPRRDHITHPYRAQTTMAKDGLAGWCDRSMHLCLGLALWNGKERATLENALASNR